MALEDDLFRALADPTRRGIFEVLAETETTVKGLTERFEVSQPAISQHLATLKRWGSPSSDLRGRNTFYRARMEGLAPLEGWLTHYRFFWNAKLQKLNRLLDDEK